MKFPFRILAALGVLAMSICAIAEENAAQLVARYDNLTLGGSSVTVSNLTITSGSLKLTLANGSAAPVKAGDQIIGIYFKGDGSFDYSAKDQVELPIMQTNLKNTKSAVTVQNGMLHAAFHEVLIAAENAPLPALEGAAGQALGDAFTANRVTFANDQESKLAIDFAAHQLHAARQRIFRAEFDGDEEWVYSADTEDERLARLYTLDFDDRARRVERYEAIISERPVGRSRYDVHPYDALLTALDYTVVASDGRDLAVSVTETYLPRVDGAKGFVLGLTNQLHADGPKPPRHYTVKAITAEDGTPLAFAHRNGVLLVSLPRPTMAAMPVKLKFDLEGDILVRAGGDNQWFLTSRWFPEPSIGAIAMTVHGVTKVKAPFIPFAGGKTLSRKTDGDYNVIETQIDQPVNFAYVSAGKYWTEEETRGNLTIRTASYAQKNPRGAKKVIALAFDAIKYYEYFLGPFPVQELTVIQVNDLGSGVSPAGMVLITSDLFKPLITEQQIDEASGYAEDINQVFAHEIAHQYWGMAVRPASGEEWWLAESFAEYSSALFMKKYKGEGDFKRMLAHWKADANESHKLAPIPLADRITTPNNYDSNRAKLLYGKGPYLLAAIHKQVGDDQFLTFMKSYQKSFRNKVGTTKDVAGLLGFMTKQDFKPFFEQYYWGTDVPEIK